MLQGRNGSQHGWEDKKYIPFWLSVLLSFLAMGIIVLLVYALLSLIMIH